MYKEKDHLKEVITSLPEKPGIYKFFSSDGSLIYVGKAKNIRKRVSSYFNKLSGLDNKTKKLVSKIAGIEFTIVNSEFDAYLLENNLIKSNKPRFNILLKDDKTYPYLYISNERFPRLVSTRKLDKSLGTFYGPYTSVKAMNTVMDLIRKLYAIRTCTYNLSEKNIENRKFKVCLEYHIGNCKAPCEGLIKEEEYNQNIDQIKYILKGKLSMVSNYFKEKMEDCASKLNFEKAQFFKEKLDLLQKFQSGSIIVNTNLSDLDVITIISEEDFAVVNYFSLTDGIITKTKTIEIKKRLAEADSEILLTSLISLREELESENTEILTNIELTEENLGNLHIIKPKIGDKKRLVELSFKNAMFEMRKIKEKEAEKTTFQDKLLLSIKEDLHLKHLPERIECFDNSNIQGTNPVSAMVSFYRAKPDKKEYRHFNVKTVEGPNDFASMKEVVFRRYKRLLDENKKLPDLIVIDGGKGQLSSACEALKSLNLYGEIPIIGIAKRLEEIYYPEDNLPLFLDKKSLTLQVLQYIRDEAHRFAITFHRKKRSRNTLTSSLNKIPGIGEKTFKTLIEKYKTVKNIMNLSEEELAKDIGIHKAKLILSRKELK